MVYEQHQCSHCEYKAVKKQNLQKHIKSIHNGHKIQCPHCEHKETHKNKLT